MMHGPTLPLPDLEMASDFLNQLRPGGPWLLVAIVPDGETSTRTFTRLEDAAAFITQHNASENIYYTVNPTRHAMSKKPSKIDIAAIEYMFSDLDPKDDESPEDAKARYLAAIEEHNATAVIDSGNGIQGLWKLTQRIELAEPLMGTDDKGKPKKVFPPQTAETVAEVEARTKALMTRLGSVAGTQNIDRLLRLPGTVNHPNANKRAKGKVSCSTRLISFNGATCTLDAFPKPEEQTTGPGTAEDSNKRETKIDWAKVEEHGGWLRTVADLPSDFNAKGRIIVEHGGTMKELNADLKQAGLIEKTYSSWSDVSFALAAIFKADNRFTLEQIAAALMCDLECNRHVTKLREAQRRRAVERLLSRSHEPQAMRTARMLPWRECKPNGMPLPSMHNARLAIEGIGVRCSCDTFHNKILFGYRGDEVRHEMQSLLGEVTDNGIIRLRQIMSDNFHFDLGDKATRDAVVSLALEHCFDPVCDMLDEAEAEWDGQERLDKMAVDYFNCTDTPFNRAAVRKTMIGAVHRARDPGCKFDTITVLESPEGYNKSTALRVLAGDENFSDASILGKHSREVQEQLAEVWIHENADLAGMKKADVDHVKTFASRQSDDARPAYGHFTKKQKRHSIEVGTTNSDEYLQSQTGNRRFWPLVVTKKIDIEKLRHDRLQLWGEAAKYESDGEDITLDEKLWPAAAEEQEQRRTKDPWEDVVADLPKNISTNASINASPQTIQIIHEDNGGKELVATADLLQHVLSIPIGQQTSSHGMRLATVMKLAGWERGPSGRVSINGKQVRGYFRFKHVQHPQVGAEVAAESF